MHSLFIVQAAQTGFSAAPVVPPELEELEELDALVACELLDELWLDELLDALWPVVPEPVVVVPVPVELALLAPAMVVPTPPCEPLLERAPWLEECVPDVDEVDGTAVSVGPQATWAWPIATARDNNEVRRQFN